MLGGYEPGRMGLVTNFAQPEGNVTGVAWFGLMPKQMEILKEFVPNLRRVAYVPGLRVGGPVYLPPEAVKIGQEDGQIAASALGFTWQNFRALDVANDYDEIFARLEAEHFDAAYMPISLGT
jgi:hypothetical protein